MSKVDYHHFRQIGTPKNNAEIVSQYERLKQASETKKTHFFEGRYENIYVSRDALTTAHALLEQIEKQCNAILQSEKALRLGFWFNEMPPQSVTLPHTHDDGYERLSGVYYLSVPDDSGNLILGDEPSIVEIIPKEGELILFAPDLTHEVSRNNSDETRFSIGFNIGPIDKDE